MSTPQEFFEVMEHVDQQVHMAITDTITERSISHLAAAISLLRDLVTRQHEQIVDLNSRVEYGYTHREVSKR